LIAKRMRYVPSSAGTQDRSAILTRPGESPQPGIEVSSLIAWPATGALIYTIFGALSVAGIKPDHPGFPQFRVPPPQVP